MKGSGLPGGQLKAFRLGSWAGTEVNDPENRYITGRLCAY
jgi:hypothetical protein